MAVRSNIWHFVTIAIYEMGSVLLPASLRLFQYRNYTDRSFSLDRHTIFVGPNGSGKTNIVEAIRTLSVTKSYRATRDSDAIHWNDSWCRIELTAPNETFVYVLTEEGAVTKKVIQHNGIAMPLAKVYGLLPSVLFSPESMQLIGGAPSERRRFLDTVLSQCERDYITHLLTYRKVMRERHFILLRLQQGLGASDELDFWDCELVNHGSAIVRERQSFITDLNVLLATIYPHFIGEDGEKLELRYKPSVQGDDLAKRLASSRSYDIKTGTTNVGPHRDELLFLLSGRDVTLFASRGEIRRVVLAIKLAEADYLRAHQERDPIILLDDVFSELDGHRRDALIRAAAAYSTLITTTDIDFLPSEQLAEATVHQLL
jgi:DNA replication and repair protein RecF